MKESIQPTLQPSAHKQEMSAQTKDMACWQSKRESMKPNMQPSAHRQEEVGAQTKKMSAQTDDMAC